MFILELQLQLKKISCPVLKFADNLNLNEIGLKVKDYASELKKKNFTK